MSATPAPDARRFVAVPVPDAARVLLEAARAPALATHPQLTWTRPAGWHLTLAFCGEVRGADLPALTAALTAVAADHAPIEVRTAGARRLGDGALVVTLDDAPSGALARLGDALQGRLAADGLPVHPRPVVPHVTLARAGRRVGAGRAALEAAAAAVAPVTARFPAETVALVRSELGGGPARYVPEVEVALGGPG